jgi:hypothetical protein
MDVPVEGGTEAVDEAHRPEAGMCAGAAALAQMGLDDAQQEVQHGADGPRREWQRAQAFSSAWLVRSVLRRGRPVSGSIDQAAPSRVSRSTTSPLFGSQASAPVSAAAFACSTCLPPGPWQASQATSISAQRVS